MTDVKIGLETHVQLDTDTKLFCGCPNREADEPNTHVCETCLGHPGSKPRLNDEALARGVKTAQALQCDINEDIFFSRKTYFYPDMSKNYQITQYEVPVGEEGSFEVKVGDEKKDIGITRLHIEEDPAKLVHEGGQIGKSNYTKVDYNRAGTPLLEIVTDPDFKSPEEARAYLQQLAQMLEYLEVYFPESDFAIKSDANISIEGGQRVEVKNITGTKGIEQALSYEISRQKQLKKRGREVEQETRNYDANQEITEKLREKETEEDYGYIFDPDLTRQELSENYRKALRETIPELPHEKFERFKEEYGLKEKIVESLISDPEIAEHFEELAQQYDAQLVASWMTGDLKKVLNYNDMTYSESPLKIHWLNTIIGLLDEDQISDRNAEQLLRELVENPREPDDIIEEKDLLKAEESEIDSFVEEVVEENPDAVDDYHAGEEEALNFLVGQVMQKSQGKADPKTAREKLKEQLD
ncbi:Asp-tRNA(Asn)/Glu-tRNA(Gln) amidotransferase subunit GatB [Candidatus Nanohaloarchaea archaeon]|nr:Asp-tRNA(Asn)/Glu-tRNA(Gln) amidotransferase subunit GatB [Candidatus Nanohaloarchaea archaeon]